MKKRETPKKLNTIAIKSKGSFSNILDIWSEIGCLREPNTHLTYEAIEADELISRMVFCDNFRSYFEQSAQALQKHFEPCAEKDFKTVHDIVAYDTYGELREAFIQWRKARELVIESLRAEGLKRVAEALAIVQDSINEIEKVEERELQQCDG